MAEPGWGSERGKSGLDRLEGVVRMMGTTPHPHNKIDALREFEALAKALVVNGEFASEEAILSALEDRGVEQARGIIALVRATRGGDVDVPGDGV